MTIALGGRSRTDGPYGAVALPPVPDGAVMLTVHIQRYNPELDELPHTESYRVPALPGDRLLNVLHYIKWYIDGTLTFRRSCAHGVCGSDAMRINGRNRLCCKVLVKDLIGDKKQRGDRSSRSRACRCSRT